MSEASEQERTEYGLGAGEVRHEPAASRGKLRLYVAVLCAAPFVMIFGTLYWMSTAAYVRHAQYPSFVGIGYGTRLKGADCDVVVDGDSTALVGVEPELVEKATGLKTCNIAEMAGVKVVNGNMVLDAYLAQNRRPQYVVFLFAPENLTQPREWTTVAHFEGVFFRMQYKPDAEFARYSVRHPEEIINASELGLRTGVQWMLDKPLPPELARLREMHGGWMPEPGSTLTSCPEMTLLRTPEREWVNGLRSKYGVEGTRVVVDVTPEPACASDRGFYEARLGGVIDNELGTLPLEDYTDTGRLHTNAAGADALSAMVAAQVVALEKGAL